MKKQTDDKAEGEILLTIGIIGFLVLVVVVGVPFAFAMHWIGGAADVVQHETDPHIMLQKYRLMLTQQNSLEELKTNVGVYQKQLEDIKINNQGTPRNHWAASDREQYDNIANAVSASKITFNNLAAQYNSEMKDISWAFCNQAQLPDGATVVLNREYVAYII